MQIPQKAVKVKDLQPVGRQTAKCRNDPLDIIAYNNCKYFIYIKRISNQIYAYTNMCLSGSWTFTSQPFKINIIIIHNTLFTDFRNIQVTYLITFSL